MLSSTKRPITKFKINKKVFVAEYLLDEGLIDLQQTQP